MRHPRSSISARRWSVVYVLFVLLLSAACVGSGSARAQTPAGCARNGDYVFKHLAVCGWAGPGNTGYQVARCPGGRLAANPGSPRRTIHIRRPNTVVSCQNITGCLSIEAQHVTVRNVKIACTTGTIGESANGSAVIKVQDGASASISHAVIDGMRGVHACVWHQGTALVVDSINCANVDDGVFSWADTGYSNTTGDNFTIENSYFHAFTVRTANGHIDGYQTEGAAHGTILHNTYLMTSDRGNDSDSAIAIWDSLCSSYDITLRHNLIAGGGFAVYAEDYSPSETRPAGGDRVTGIHFVNNVFSRHLFGCVGYYGVWYPRGHPSDGWQRSGNTLLETGAGLDRGNPSYQGRPCT